MRIDEIVRGKKSRWWPVADRIGAVASSACAIHCAVLPFVLALLPLLGLEFLANHRFEQGFVMFASMLALLALVRGCLRHRGTLPLMLAGPGVFLLLFGVTYAKGVSRRLSGFDGRVENSAVQGQQLMICGFIVILWTKNRQE